MSSTDESLRFSNVGAYYLHAVYEVHSCSQLIVTAYVKFFFSKLNG